MTDFILKGSIVQSKNKDELEIAENGYVICKGGLSEGIFSSIPEEYKDLEVIDYSDKLIVPGFTDLHVHAPQYNFRSVGMDSELLEWLNQHAFPEESKFADINYAKNAYSLFAEDMISSFSTRVCMFGTLHTDSTILLMDIFEKSGLKTYVGKVNMDRNSPDYLREKSAEESLKETERFLDLAKQFKNTKPIITPRFIPSCSDELMTGLGELIKKYDLAVQSHLSENPSEIAWVKELCPKSTSYGDAYRRYNMMNSKSIMAHCVHMTDEEIDIMRENSVFAAHCPESNMNLASGISPVSRMLDEGINIGLGSDVSGGTNLSIPKQMRLAAQNSKLYWRYIDNKYKVLTLENIFYMATRGGGKFFGNVGSFDKGYEFDALVIDDSAIKTMIKYNVRERLERTVYLGNKFNIVSKYVAGNKVI